jgi:hypothetical protein
MKALVHRWTRRLAVPVIASAVLGLTGTASAGTASATGAQTTGTTTVSVETVSVTPWQYNNTGTMLSGHVSIKPRSVTGWGQITGANAGTIPGGMHFSLSLFRLTTTPGSAGSGWLTLYDRSAGLLFSCPVLGGAQGVATWDASSVRVGVVCPALIDWELHPLALIVNITETA